MPSPIPPTERACEHCGETFIATDASTRFCSGRCRRDRCEQAARAKCIDCDAVLGAGSSWRGTQRCTECEWEHRWNQHYQRDRQIETWWLEGLTLREIADRLDWTIGHISQELHRLREAGYDLPYRRRPGKRNATRFPEQVAA